MAALLKKPSIVGAVNTGGLFSTGTIDFPSSWHLGSGQPWSAALLFYNLGQNDLYGFVCKMDAQSAGNSEFCCGLSGSGVFAAVAGSVGNAGGVGFPTTNAWRLIGSGGDSSGFTVFDGVNYGTGAGNYSTDTGANCGFSIGNFRPNGSYKCNGHIAGAWVWNARLGEAEWRAMSLGVHPEDIRPGALRFAYYPVGCEIPTASQIDNVSRMFGVPSGSLVRVSVPPPVSFFRTSPMAQRRIATAAAAAANNNYFLPLLGVGD